MKRVFRTLFTVVAISLLGLICAAQTKSARGAQEQQPKSSRQATTPANNPASQELTKASNQAAERDENAQFRESPSVKFFARKLHLSVATTYWLFFALNFLIIAYLAWLAFFRKGISFMQMPAIPAAAQARRVEIAKRIGEAQQASDDANRRLRDIEAKLAQLGSEIGQLQAGAAELAKQEESRLKAAAEEEKQRLLASAEQEIAAATASARRELRVYAASLAVELAEKRIKIDSATDQALVRDFTDQLGRNGH